MSKSILIIDTPSNCKECPLNSHTDYDFDVCWVTQGKGDCPLRQLPDREDPSRLKEGTYFKAYDQGWNDCLEEITGENE